MYLIEFLDEGFEFVIKNFGILYNNLMIEKVLKFKILVIMEVELVY